MHDLNALNGTNADATENTSQYASLDECIDDSYAHEGTTTTRAAPRTIIRTLIKGLYIDGRDRPRSAEPELF